MKTISINVIPKIFLLPTCLHLCLGYCQNMSLHHRELYTNIYGDQGCQFTKSAILLLVQKKWAAQDLQKYSPMILDAILIRITLWLIRSVSTKHVTYICRIGNDFVYLGKKVFSFFKKDTTYYFEKRILQTLRRYLTGLTENYRGLLDLKIRSQLRYITSL